MHSGCEQTKEDTIYTFRVICEYFKLNHEIVMTNCGGWRRVWASFHLEALLLWNLILSISTWSFYCRIHRRMFSHLRKGMAEQPCRERHKKRCKNVCWTFFLCPLALDNNLWQKSLLLKIPLFVCLSRAFWDGRQKKSVSIFYALSICRCGRQ